MVDFGVLFVSYKVSIIVRKKMTPGIFSPGYFPIG
jgi:hypothetical protein